MTAAVTPVNPITHVTATLADQVRAAVARSGEPLTPSVVAGVLRAQGGPVGDATVLEVLDLLRSDLL